MAAASQNRVPENLKKQLAFAVRSIQWSYAIFWTVSVSQPGVLEWGDGYYNGDIKTRKTAQAMELKADQLGLQRSQQLRDLYEFLCAGESTIPPQIKRAPAALSPEDLTDTEWYYLLCMSFVFNAGEGMPGRTLANGETVWLCNAQYADNKIFSRSLLAKSAAIQTVICFPFLEGVVELGATDQVMEDLNLVQCFKTSLLDNAYALLSDLSNPQEVYDSENLGNEYVTLVENEDLPMASLDRLSNGFDPDEEADQDSFMVEEINGGASQVQSWQFLDEELGNCVHQSLNSSDCISQTFMEPLRKVAFAPRIGRVQETRHQHQMEIQEGNQTTETSLDFRNDDLHYQGVLSMLFKTSHQLILGPQSQNCGRKSSFTSWKKSESPEKITGSGNSVIMSQKMIKKLLFEVPRMHQEDHGTGKTDELNSSRLLSEERKQRAKLDERFMILRSMVPSITKVQVDKISILDDTIEYLQELERRVQELESCREESNDADTVIKRKGSHEAGETTSANCRNNDEKHPKTTFSNKRKASEISSFTDHIAVRSDGNEMVIEMRCGWRESVLLEIMDVVSNLNLDSHSVQSSACDGILCLTMKCKQKGHNVAAAGMIKQALQRVAWNCSPFII